MSTYRNIDAPSRPQKVTIEFIRGQTPDENPDLSFLEQEYTGESDAAKYRDQDAERLAAYNAGDWHMRGLWVEARVLVPIGQGSFSTYNLRSPGLWGVESDCGADYENEVWCEQEQELRSALKAMGAALVELKS